MRLLLDTHIVLSVLQLSLERDYPQFVHAIRSEEAQNHVSVVSLWEIALKVRLGKLTTRLPLERMAEAIMRQDIVILAMRASHAVAEPVPEPPTRDPFDRMLLAQAQIEGLRLVTVDRALADHPVTFRS
jgi:PIN domain nuclease of toxin-antitoxin system